MTDRLEIQFPLAHKALAAAKLKLNGNADPLNKLIRLHKLPEITHDTELNRELHLSDLENHLVSLEVTNG